MPVAYRACRSRCLWSLFIVGVVAAGAFAEEEEKSEPGIRDNSFLVEEAFNQEQGVVQHIFNWVPSWERNNGTRSNNFNFVYTDEWPLGSEKHQLSYTLPMLYTNEQLPGEQPTQAQGFGDVMLNYRYQVFDGNLDGWWVAPRFSLIFPTGDEEASLGRGKMGYQINLPFSKEFEKAAIHFNAGATYTPGVTVGIDQTLFPLIGRDLRGYNLGASGIYFLKRYFHLVFETVAVWDEGLNADASRDHTFQYIVSPGFRWAPYTKDDTQWVVGAALPIGLTRDAPDIAAFFYMSFEHRIWPKHGE